MSPDVGMLRGDIEDTSEAGYMYQEGIALVSQAKALAVTDQHTFDLAAIMARTLRGYIERVKEHFKPRKQEKKAEWQKEVDEEKAYLKAPEEWLATLGRAMTDYDQAQRSLKAAAEAQAAQEAERLRAEALKTGKPVAPVVVPAKAVELPKADGINFRSRWVAVVMDKSALIAAVAAGKVTIDVLEVNMPMLNEFARAMKGNLSLPGVIAKEERGMTTKAGDA